jgi:hypothetical protein
MKQLILCLFLAVASPCAAQFSSFSVHVSGNYPYIPTKTKTSNLATGIPSSGYYSVTLNTGSIEESYKSLPGFNVSANTNYKISEKFYLTSGLTISLLRYQQRLKVNLTSAEIPFGENTQPGSPYGAIVTQTNYQIGFDDSGNFGKTTVWSLQVPVLIGTSVWKGKLHLEAGLAVSTPLRATTYTYESTFDGFLIGTPQPTESPAPGNIGSFNIELKQKNITDQFSSVAIGGVVKVGYRVVKNLQADVMMQPNLTTLYNADYRNAKTRLTTFNLGLSYFLKSPF